MSAVDWTDPCARAEALRAAYYARISGQQEVEILTRTVESEQRVRFSEANGDALLSELRTAEAECAALGGMARPRRRFAITAGFRRSR